ncbi:MAG: peptidoglycan-binding protein [Lachnospiraceae bacterium]|jgi:hypothetical protein|nr:peptidoglycan-binding protein [Lachnospiraceae bacterium]
MAKILVYNDDTGRMETYYRGENEAMPYNTNRTLTVREFKGASNSQTVWTTKRAMQSWNSQRYLYGGPIPVGYGFRRPWEGGHGTQSQHYAGVSFDVAQTLSPSQRTAIRNVAVNSGVWRYVEPAYLTPTWVHFDDRGTPAACGAGYPLIKYGSRGVYVLIAQDGLNTIGYRTGGLDGVFGNQTRNAVRNYQVSRGLSADGIIGCNTWLSLQEEVVAKGRTNTTID